MTGGVHEVDVASVGLGVFEDVEILDGLGDGTAAGDDSGDELMRAGGSGGCDGAAPEFAAVFWELHAASFFPEDLVGGPDDLEREVDAIFEAFVVDEEDGDGDFLARYQIRAAHLDDGAKPGLSGGEQIERGGIGRGQTVSTEFFVSAEAFHLTPLGAGEEIGDCVLERGVIAEDAVEFTGGEALGEIGRDRMVAVFVIGFGDGETVGFADLFHVVGGVEIDGGA